VHRPSAVDHKRCGRHIDIAQRESGWTRQSPVADGERRVRVFRDVEHSTRHGLGEGPINPRDHPKNIIIIIINIIRFIFKSRGICVGKHFFFFWLFYTDLFTNYYYYFTVHVREVILQAIPRYIILLYVYTYIHITCILVIHTLLYRKYVNGIIILIGGRAICRLQIIIAVDIV